MKKTSFTVIFLAAVFLVMWAIATVYGNPAVTDGESALDVPVSGEAAAFPVPAIADDRRLAAFETVARDGSVSNVVGFLGSGSFGIYVPDWIVDNWTMGDGTSGKMIFVPKDPGMGTFSDIVMVFVPSDESFNAAYAYETGKTGYGVVSEIFPNGQGDLIIYHLEWMEGNLFHHRFFVDGLGKTAQIDFSGDKADYILLTQKIKEFVRGLTKGEGPRG